MTVDELKTLSDIQKFDIKYIIGEWYHIWENSLFEYNKNYIDVAVYMLKNMIKISMTNFENARFDLTEAQFIALNDTIDLWRKNNCPTSNDGGITNDFLNATDILIDLIQRGTLQ